MFSTLKTLAAAAVAVTFLAACGSAATPTTPAAEYETLTGVVAPLATPTTPAATHQLVAGNQILAVLVAAPAAEKVQLNNFVGQKVELSGIASQTTSEPPQKLLQVVAVQQVTDAAAPTGYRRYRDEAAGFSVDYAARLTPRAGAHGVAFYTAAQQKLAEVLVLQNPLQQDLATWLTDKYGYQTTELEKVGVAGLTGYKFQNATGAVIYLARAADVLALAWYDADPANREANRKTYLELVQSLTTFTPVVAAAAATPGQNLAGFGGPCGGLLATGCASGLTCQLDATKTDGSGVCVTVGGAALTGGVRASSVPAAAGAAAISELERTRGWYYGDRANKKPGTPDDWILVDADTRFAMWRRPAELTEILPALPAATAQFGELSPDQQAVLAYLQTHLAGLTPEPPTAGSWQLKQVAFAEPNYAYAVYATATQMRRLLTTFTVVGADVAVTTQAYFRPVEGGAWLLLEGVDLAERKSTTVVDGAAVAAAAPAAGLREMQNRTGGYRLQYPAAWYWRPVGSTQTDFSDRPFPAGTVLVTAEVVAGEQFVFGQPQPSGTQFAIFVRLKNGKSLRLTAGSAQLELLQKMAATASAL